MKKFSLIFLVFFSGIFNQELIAQEDYDLRIEKFKAECNIAKTDFDSNIYTSDEFKILYNTFVIKYKNAIKQKTSFIDFQEIYEYDKNIQAAFSAKIKEDGFKIECYNIFTDEERKNLKKYLEILRLSVIDTKNREINDDTSFFKTSNTLINSKVIETSIDVILVSQGVKDQAFLRIFWWFYYILCSRILFFIKKL